MVEEKVCETEKVVVDVLATPFGVTHILVYICKHRINSNRNRLLTVYKGPSRPTFFPPFEQ